MDLAQSALIDRFRDLLSTRLHVPPSQSSSGKLARILGERVAALRLPAPERYLAMLGLSTAASRHEWDLLIGALTVGESFFFRDEGLFGALRERVLPELLRERRGRLRVWSAGCSEGQELYSVAMLLHDMGVDAARRELVGTDVNPAAVEAARRARYAAWSFRGVETAVTDRHFAAREGRFELRPALRQGVAFRQHDLVNGSYPNTVSGLDSFDLILCRNVLIYFHTDVVGDVVHRLVDCLNPGGYLVLGNAEVHSRQLRGVTPHVVGGRVLYRRASASRETPAPTTRRQLTAASRSQGADARLEDASDMLADGDSVGADGPAPAPTTEASEGASAWVAVARARANEGKHAEARSACYSAIEADPLDAAPHMLLAKVAEELGDVDEAKERLRQAIYLDADNTDAYLTLASLYDSAGETRHASRAYRGAVRAAEADLANEDEDTYAFIQSRIEELNAGA